MQLSSLLLLLQEGAKSGSRHKDVEASQTCFLTLKLKNAGCTCGAPLELSLVLITLEKLRLQGQACRLIAQGQLTRKDCSISMKLASARVR